MRARVRARCWACPSATGQVTQRPLRYTSVVPPHHSSLRGYGLRAQTERTAYSLAAILAALSVAPAYAVAGHDGALSDATLSKKEGREKLPQLEEPEGVEDGEGVEVDGDDAVEVVAPAPTVSAPVATPAPTVAPKPKPPKPVATEAPAPVRTAPQPTATPDRSPTPAADVGIGAVPVAPAATPGSAAPRPPARARRRPVDLAGNGGVTRTRRRSPSGAGPVSYRESARTGRRVLTVPTSDGGRRRRVSVPGGVFGVLPSAAIEATSEVRGATAEGGTRRSASLAAGSEPDGVAETISQPLVAIDEATGVAIPPLLAVAAIAAAALGVGVGIRRQLHRW